MLSPLRAGPRSPGRLGSAFGPNRLTYRAPLFTKPTLYYPIAGAERGQSRSTRLPRSRWGSSSASGQVLLNPELTRAPLSCVEYTIAHELCHVSELNHTKRFYRFLARLLPDWKARKERLDEWVA